MLRAFTDSAGKTWRVWDVLPDTKAGRFDDSSTLPSLDGTAFADGWLCFESEAEKRRMAPIPSEWTTLPESRLAQMCQRALVVSPTTRLRREHDANPLTR